MIGYKTYTPYTSSIRHVCLIDKTGIWHKDPIRHLLLQKQMARRGSNVFSRSVRGIRGNFRIVDFCRDDHVSIPGIVVRLEYDPNRSSFIALLLYKNNVCCYVLCPSATGIGDVFINYSGVSIVFNTGDCMTLRKIPVGTILHNVEVRSGYGGTLIRAAGSFGILFRKFYSLHVAVVKLRSGIKRAIPLECRATLGMVSNKNHWSISIGKAGRNRWIGRRPVVRGVAMNPVDHPHGGGEGKKSKKADPRNIWGRAFKWKRTGKVRS